MLHRVVFFSGSEQHRHNGLLIGTLAKRLRRGRLRSKDLCVTFGSCKQDCPTGLLRSGITIPVVAVTDITVEPRLIPPAGRGALMGLRSRTRFTKSKR